MKGHGGQGCHGSREIPAVLLSTDCKEIYNLILLSLSSVFSLINGDYHLVSLLSVNSLVMLACSKGYRCEKVVASSQRGKMCFGTKIVTFMFCLISKLSKEWYQVQGCCMQNLL